MNHKGSTPLHLSARHGHRACCERLVAAPGAGGAVAAANDTGRTAVHLAAWQGHHEAIVLDSATSKRNHIDCN